MLYLALFVFLISYFFYLLPTLKRQLCAMQDADYFYEKFVVFMKAQRKTQMLWLMMAFIGAAFLLQRMFPLELYLLLHAVALVILALVNRRKPQPKSPVKDGRIGKVAGFALLAFLVFLMIVAALFRETFFWEMPFVLSFLTFMSDTWILLGTWMASPGEKRREKQRAKNAAAVRAAYDEKRASAGKAPVKVIGVAGSFGKTGFIQVAKQVLGQKYRVLAPEGNLVGSIYNAAALLEELEKQEADLALVEITARHPGEIKAFREAIPVDSGVLTSAADRSMETFLAKDRMSATLMELAEDLPEMLINYEDEQLRKQKHRASILRFGSYKNDGIPQHLDLWAKNLSCDLTGSRFTLTTRDGQTAQMEIPQLGRYIALYGVGAAGLGLQLGLTLEQIQDALKNLTPIAGYPALLPAGDWPERLKKGLAKPWEAEGEMTKTPAAFRILDDPNEASLDGAKETLNLLSTFEGFRILVTRGLRGQGESEDEFNRLLGRHSAKCADAIVVIGKEKFSCIEDGAQRGGMSISDLHLAADLRDAVERTQRLAEEMGKKCCVAVLGRI